MKVDHVARGKSVTAAQVAGAYREAADSVNEAVTAFKAGDFVVYPAHGVGRVEAVGMEEIAGYQIDIIRISFSDTQMVLRIPVRTAVMAGLRPLADSKALEAVVTTLGGRARSSRAVWSRRAKEYQDKINSGDLQTLAEVARDLHRGPQAQPASHSQRALFELAMERLVGEFAAVAGVDKSTATTRIELALAGKKTGELPAEA